MSMVAPVASRIARAAARADVRCGPGSGSSVSGSGTATWGRRSRYWSYASGVAHGAVGVVPHDGRVGR